MKSFSLDSNHDIVINNNIVQLAEGSELKRQTAECTLNTKIGEWFLNSELGIDFNAILGKREIDHETIKGVIKQGLLQVDETFTIDEFSAEYDKNTRGLKIMFTASTEDGKSITIADVWG